MPVKIGINGFGRIGRHVLRIGLLRPDLEFVAINDITDAKTLAHLFKYDSVFGPFKGEIEVDRNDIIINGKALKVYSERDPKQIPWGEVGAEIVAESTGIFRTREQVSAHLGETVKKVIITAPAKGKVDFSVVMALSSQRL